jgi:hypothetical protein
VPLLCCTLLGDGEVGRITCRRLHHRPMPTVCRTAGKSVVLHALHFFTARQSRKSGNAARRLGKKQRRQRPAKAKYSTVLLSNRIEERNIPRKDGPGSTHKAYARAAAIKATKPTRLLHANLTNCDVIADL